MNVITPFCSTVCRCCQYNIMIRLFSTLCECFQTIKNINDYQCYLSFCNTIDKELLQCPNCPASDIVFSKNGTYKRDFLCRVKSETISHTIKVQSMECASCGHSHALLPSIVVPHSPFSLHFVISLLYDYITHNYVTVAELCENYQISISSFYRIYHRFLVDQINMSKLMKYEIIDSKKLLVNLLSNTFQCLDNKLMIYFEKNGYSFLQPERRIRQLLFSSKTPPSSIR